MRATNWSESTTTEIATRRAGGRRRYNRWRQLLVTRRLGSIVQIMRRNGWTGREWGIRAKIARELRVSRVTIARDLQHLERAIIDLAYATDWLRFYRWWRRTYGDCFGPHPGAAFPQMDHSRERMPRAPAAESARGSNG